MMNLDVAPESNDEAVHRRRYEPLQPISTTPSNQHAKLCAELLQEVTRGKERAIPREKPCKKYAVRQADGVSLWSPRAHAHPTGEVCTDQMLPTRRLRSGQAWRAACQRANQQALRRPLLAHALELLVDRDQAGAPDAEVDEARTKARVASQEAGAGSARARSSAAQARHGAGSPTAV